MKDAVQQVDARRMICAGAGFGGDYPQVRAMYNDFHD